MRKTTAGLTLLMAAMALPVFAQKTTATIRGTVTDATGALVPGANVTVRSEGAGFTRPTVTNSSGSTPFSDAFGRMSSSLLTVHSEAAVVG